MPTCVSCAAPVRSGARFCTQCGSPVGDLVIQPGVAEPDAIPARIPHERRAARALDRSTAATWALVAGVAPLLLSLTGNLISAPLGVTALARVESGEIQGAWAPVVTVLALVFVGNAALLTVCAMSGIRGVRETANGITRGRAFAVAGLAAGGMNLVLWVVGLVITVSGLNAVLG